MDLNNIQKLRIDVLEKVKVEIKRARELNHESHIDFLQEVQSLINNEVADIEEFHQC